MSQVLTYVSSLSPPAMWTSYNHPRVGRGADQECAIRDLLSEIPGLFTGLLCRVLRDVLSIVRPAREIQAVSCRVTSCHVMSCHVMSLTENSHKGWVLLPV